MQKIVKELKSRKIQVSKLNGHLTIAFLTEFNMKKLNQHYRKKNKATDVLSFSIEDSPQSNKAIGELALCPTYIQNKAKKRGVSSREETAYIVLHGLLHLLGYEHEKSKKSAEEMYSLQDDIFSIYFKL